MSENVVIKKDRTVTVPASEAKIGVQYDHNVNVITFDCPRYPDDDRSVDLSTMQIYINYMLPDKTLGSYLAENVKVDTNNPDTIHFDWKITRNVTQVKGALQALVCIKKVDAEGNELYHWNTDLIQSFRVGEGMECLETISSDYADVISQLLVNMNTVTGEFEALSADVTARTSEETLQGLVNNAASDEKLRSIVNAYMEANPVGINVDDTLAVSGDAADAKITGDRITELKGDLAELENCIYDVKNGEAHDGYFVSLHNGKPLISTVGDGYSLTTYKIEKDIPYIIKTNSSIFRIGFNNSGFVAEYGLSNYQKLDGNSIYKFTSNGEYSYIHISVKTPATPNAQVDLFEVSKNTLPNIENQIERIENDVIGINDKLDANFKAYNGYISTTSGIEAVDSSKDEWVKKFLITPKLPIYVTKIETKNNYFVRINKYDKNGVYLGKTDFLTTYNDFDFVKYDYIPQFKKNDSADTIVPSDFNSENIIIEFNSDYKMAIYYQNLCKNGWSRLEERIADLTHDYITKNGLSINGVESNYSEIKKYVLQHNDFLYNGKLTKSGKKILNKDGNEIILQGIGTHSLYEYQSLYTNQSVKTLKYYGINLIRISVYLSDTVAKKSNGRLLYGWLNHSEELKPIIENLIDIATENDMYVLLDWHSYHSIDGGDVTIYQTEQEEFFRYFSGKYANNDNILYEVHNEPYQNTATELLPSVMSCSSIIRSNNEDAIIICGYGKSDNGKSAVNDMNYIFNEVNNLNIFISPHLYTGDQSTTEIKDCINANIPIFVSEWGNSSLSGDNKLNYSVGYEMFELLYANNISNALWKWTFQDMSTAVLLDDEYAIKYLYPYGGYTDGMLSDNGRFYFRQTFNEMIKLLYQIN